LLGKERNVAKSLRFGAVDRVTVTLLLDNWSDLIVRSTDSVQRFTKAPLLAEHGFSALIEIGGGDKRVLWDAGASETALLENARRMEIDLSGIDAVALSHGHSDHTGALGQVLKLAVRREPRRWRPGATAEGIDAWQRDQRLPVVAHPAAFRERWATREDGSRQGPFPAPPREAWEASGARIILSAEPYQLAPGCWTTGTVPRRSFEQAGRSTTRLYREGGAFLQDDLEDDQAVVIHVRGKGLVILAGCAHAGIVNTVTYAREISGVDRVWAILGGFHLAPADAAEVERTIDAIEGMEPQVVCPSHCSGFRAMCRFAGRMPEAFVRSVVGTKFLF
jgi:7,8-dihydropterin-6-yl-methyl-4-(beta-D-ribofuranosyl)aminobenzene 5'-phosphate synthase